jgi:hypothetical protein
MNPNAPFSIGGNATLQVNMTDRGEPGGNDHDRDHRLHKSGGLWFSSNWSGSLTLEQALGGGNVVAH